LVRSRRASDLRARLDRRPAGSADGAELHADDLLLGYRLDVRDDGPVGELLPAFPPWRSLCSRRSRYEISGRALDGGDGFIREEGQLKPDAMVAVAGGLGGDEVVARWDGWSLAVARPSPTGNGTAPRPATELAWRFAVVPPLPALRFGREYRLRIRAADLAGGGLSVADLDGDASASLATRPIAYGRVEPVPAPVLLSEIELGPGEGAERLVVRSLGGPPPEPPDPKIPQEFLPPPARVVDPYPPIRRRRFAAPPVSVELAEQHGLFDELSPEASWELARRAMPLLIGDDSPGPDPALPRWLPDPLAHRWVARLTGVGSASAEWAPAGTEAHVLAPAVLEVRRGEMTAVLQAGGTVTVTLPPAGEAVVELSSAPAEEDLAQLALPGWPSDPTVAMQVLDAVRQGRQAHVTPARQVQLVHAVQRPLAVPRGSVGVHRAPGDTTVTVTRLDSIVIDRASTARLDVTAQWREWGDAPAAIDTRSAPVASVTIPSSGLHPAQARHEMGDTRRRTIAYTATVVSRFQEYFDQALLAADPGAFTVVGPAMVVDVPSSARPPAPAVRAVVPAFRWEGGPPVAGWQEWRHVRRGGIVRIHMAPGWFASGEGELLGVVASTEPFPPRVSWAFLSQAGRDPARVTPDAVHWITPAEAGPLAGPPAVQTLPEAGRRVAVLPFAPWPDPDGGWIADVDLGPLANSSYMPFVDLALCRYQPVSVDGHHLSQVVRSDFLQLLPDRTLTVRRESSLVTVTLAGLGPGGQLPNQVEVWIEAWRGPAGGAVNSLPGDLTMLDAASDVEAWQRVAGPARGGLGQAVAIPVPSENGPRRVVVREIEPERFGVDTPGPAATVAELRRRVVFVDVVQLL
ncbi:MAG TPA: hypothetical protein VG478_10230, partial [Acidimicrobiales bacterium]|nr:hypothetical protein [Acidimicrobiales bacterium]